MSDIWHFLKKQKHIVLYGMGNGAEIMVKYLAGYGIEVSGFFASDGFVRGQSFLGKRVLTFSEAKEAFPDMTVLVSFGTNRQEVIDNILSLDAPVFAPEVPVAGEKLFNYEFYNEHSEEIKEVRKMLADAQSKHTFDELIEYKLSGRIEHLLNCETSENEMYSCLNLKNETYLDLGAYNGDTVLEFIKFDRVYKSITAVEPDKKNFKKLKKNTEGLNIECINAAVCNYAGETEFSCLGGRNSRIGAGEKVKAITVDSLQKAFSYIKFDVEGQEAKAIEGARTLISEKKPKMLVSAYHRSEDIFFLPLLVKKINSSYKVFLYKQKYIPAWDTNYCFV